MDDRTEFRGIKVVGRFGRGDRPEAISVRLIIGLVLASLGMLWTLDNLGMVDASRYINWWPALLVLFGLLKLTGIGLSRSMPAAAFFLLIGSVLLLGHLGIVHISLLPLFLIAAGVAVISRSLSTGGDGAASGPGDTHDRITSFALLGGVKRRNSSDHFRGGDLSAVMGGIELDLTDATPHEGRAVIDVFAMWGGVEIIVPDDWRVELEISPIMGGFEDSTKLAPDVPVAGVLVVRGFVLMGGGEVSNVKREGDRTRTIIRTRMTRDGMMRRTEIRVGPGGIAIGKDVGPAPPASAPGMDAPPPTEPR